MKTHVPVRRRIANGQLLLFQNTVDIGKPMARLVSCYQEAAAALTVCLFPMKREKEQAKSISTHDSYYKGTDRLGVN